MKKVTSQEGPATPVALWRPPDRVRPSQKITTLEIVFEKKEGYGDRVTPTVTVVAGCPSNNLLRGCPDFCAFLHRQL